MAAISLPPIAPDLHEPLTPESWEAYRRTITRWWAQWDAIDDDLYGDTVSDSLSAASRTLLQAFVHHPDHQGKPYIQVILELRRSARYAQGLYKLRLKYPKPGQVTGVDNQETNAALIATAEWGMFGGGYWHNMNARELAVLGRELATIGENSDLTERGRRIEIDHNVLTENRLGFLTHQEMFYELGKLDKLGLSEYIRGLEESEKYPNETNIAAWVRRSRLKAAGLGALTLLAGAFTGISALTLLGWGLVIYFVLSFVVYSWLLGPE